MSSLVVRAPSGSYNEEDNCSVCMAPLDMLLVNRLGPVVIHNNANGSKHPMHRTCFKTSLVASKSCCPVCREQVSWPKPKDSLIEKITGVGTLIVINGAAHATFSFLTGQPLLVAVTPGVISSLMSIPSLWLEHNELGLQRTLGAEIGIKFITSAAVIGIPAIASIAASQITESIIPNSLITATLGVTGLFPYAMKFLEDI